MDKKSIIAILVIIILVVVIGFMAFNPLGNSQNQIKIGDTALALPEGFHEGTPNQDGDINITNDYDTVFLKDCGAENITKYVKSYVKHKEKDNTTVHIKNFTANNTVVYKASLTNKTYAARYWFDYKGEVYTIYTSNANKNTDKLVTDILSSLN